MCSRAPPSRQWPFARAELDGVVNERAVRRALPSPCHPLGTRQQPAGAQRRSRNHTMQAATSSMLRRSAAAPAFSSRCTVRPAQRGPQVRSRLAGRVAGGGEAGRAPPPRAPPRALPLIAHPQAMACAREALRRVAPRQQSRRRPAVATSRPAPPPPLGAIPSSSAPGGGHGQEGPPP